MNTGRMVFFSIMARTISMIYHLNLNAGRLSTIFIYKVLSCAVYEAALGLLLVIFFTFVSIDFLYYITIITASR